MLHSFIVGLTLVGLNVAAVIVLAGIFLRRERMSSLGDIEFD